MAHGNNKGGSKLPPLKIMHCFRSPVGGIFRHVRDLIDEQIAGGHQVGILCDNNTGGVFEEAMFDTLSPRLALGLHRFKMQRSIGLADIPLLREMHAALSPLELNVLHGHGAKGGAYVRVVGSALKTSGRVPARIYCPHGGSMHYAKSSLKGRVYFLLERLFERWTDQLVFVSKYEQDQYISKVGAPTIPYRIAANGLREDEFIAVSETPHATDFVYVGMMRDLKGVDLLLTAIATVSAQRDRKISITMVGDGPDLATYRATAQRMAKHADITFHPPMPAREAFALGRCMIVPSRAESLPYIVLEALAAQRPLIATNVGGIPEIYGPLTNTLVKPDDASALAATMGQFLDAPNSRPSPKHLAQQIQETFSVPLMAGKIMQGYRETLFENESTR